ncbi:hypothetical protein JTB14_012457 [Gonioctena quinquepunctata]|nr:hypothetical protein JTB14_012457 [Gonioctena quinquepunctata]
MGDFIWDIPKSYYSGFFPEYALRDCSVSGWDLEQIQAELHRESELEVDELSLNVFSNCWNENTKRLVFTIQMIIMKGQQPVKLSIGKFSQINLQTCLATIKTTVSYYMFLRTIGEKY